MKKLEKRLRERGIERYTIYEFDKPFPFYLLDLDKLGIDAPFSNYFKCVTIELWRTCCYNIVFYDTKVRFAGYKIIPFSEEKNAIKYFNELLLDISQKQGAL